MPRRESSAETQGVRFIGLEVALVSAKHERLREDLVI